MINSIEAQRTRVLNVVCPACKAAIGALCTTQYYNAAGIQTNHTNIFHNERVVKAQTIAERAIDITERIRLHLNKEKHGT